MNENKIGVKALKAIEIAIAKLASINLGLTELHAQYLKVCIQSRMYKQAKKLIDIPIVHFDKDANIDESDIFMYYYYGGVIYTGLK